MDESMKERAGGWALNQSWKNIPTMAWWTFRHPLCGSTKRIGAFGVK